MPKRSGKHTWSACSGHFAWRQRGWSCTMYDINTLQCIYKEGGVITCIISGHRQYSVDLEQGGLNKLQFQGSQTMINKLSKMLLNAPVPTADVSLWQLWLTSHKIVSWITYTSLCIASWFARFKPSDTSITEKQPAFIQLSKSPSDSPSLKIQ